MTRGEPQLARLRPERAKYYPGINAATWFPVVIADDLGVRVDLGPGHGKRELFVFHVDVELRDA